MGSVLPAVGQRGPWRWESWRVRFFTRTDADTPVFFLASIAPSKKKEIAGGALRAMIAGTVASFMTACVAGTVPGLASVTAGDHRVAVRRHGPDSVGLKARV